MPRDVVVRAFIDPLVIATAFTVPPVIATLFAFWVDMVPNDAVAIVTALLTKDVVAICVVLVPFAAVGAKGVPDNVGLALKTTFPVPVEVVTPVPPLATGSVPVTFVTRLQ